MVASEQCDEGANGACPACGGDDLATVLEVGTAEAAQHFVLAEADPARHRELERHIRELWEGEHCRVLRCRGCGFGYAEPFVGGDATFYGLAYHRTHYPADKWEHRLTLQALAAGPARPRSLLEVGAGDGAFLRRLSSGAFRPEDVFATEFSDYGRRAIRDLGVRCEAIDVRALPNEHDGRYDVLCLFQVLEHLDRPDAVFQRLAALARGGASLFVGVPNDQRVDFFERHGALLDMPPNHLSRWTREALRLFGARHGWRLAEHRIEAEPFLPFARRFLSYRYLRAAQRPGSMPNRIRRLPSSRLRLALDAAWVALTLPPAVPALLHLQRDAVGDSQWARFERVE